MHKRDIEPMPPGLHIANAGHHWLMVTDFDGRFHGLVVMQWQPGVKRWCHSGDIATGRNVDTSGWEYVEPVAHPKAHLAPAPGPEQVEWRHFRMFETNEEDDLEVLQAQLGVLMRALPSIFKLPVDEHVRWVGFFAAMANRVGVVVDSEAVTKAFAEHGYSNDVYADKGYEFGNQARRVEYEAEKKIGRDAGGRYIVGYFLDHVRPNGAMPDAFFRFVRSHLPSAS